MCLLVPAHLGCPRQNPESRKMVVVIVCVCLCIMLLNDTVCAHVFAIKVLEYRNDFDTV